MLRSKVTNVVSDSEHPPRHLPSDRSLAALELHSHPDCSLLALFQHNIINLRTSRTILAQWAPCFQVAQANQTYYRCSLSGSRE